MKLKAPKGKHTGPYTVRDFYDAYLPRHFQFPDVAVMDTENLRMMAEAESTGGPFLLAVEACVPGMTSENASKGGNKIGIRTSGYSAEHESDVDPFPLELCVIFRPSTAHDPFEDSNPNVTTTSNSKVSISPSPPFERDHSGRGSQTRSDITSAAVAELEVHSRAFMFSVLILKDEARFIRWDRAGGVVTNRFNYIYNSHLFFGVPLAICTAAEYGRRSPPINTWFGTAHIVGRSWSCDSPACSSAKSECEKAIWKPGPWEVRVSTTRRVAWAGLGMGRKFRRVRKSGRFEGAKEAAG
ncbi:hypothetical protein F5141DRAFT_1067006 [Pisolithus sp. B1]|nr:hypothetical protein F5141DRAFT_1067006 [Pisolithus sp. B1]